jgi:uncharacterized protein (DUF58 family)
MASRGQGTSKRAGRARLTRRGRAFLVFAAILAIIAMFGGNRVFLLGACLVAALVVVARVVIRVRRLRLDATRTFHPAMVEVGGTTRVTLVITNTGRSRSPGAYWRDTLPWFPGHTDDRALPPMTGHRERFSGPNNRVRVDYELEPVRRGIYEIGPLSVESGDPFGLAVGFAELTQTHTLVVTPRVVELPGAGSLRQAGDGSSTIVQRAVAGSEDDLMTREYRRGDALRRVHWRASARHGELMVRQEEPRNQPEARIVIDTRSDGYDDMSLFGLDPSGAEPESEQFEWAVSLVASIGEHLSRTGYSVTVLETAGRQLLQPGSGDFGDAAVNPFLESLAAVRLVRDDAHPDDQAAHRPDTALAPVFAVLSRPADATLDWVINQRRPYERGTAVLLNGTRAVDRLEAAGWSVVEVAEGATVPEIWRAALRVSSHG